MAKKWVIIADVVDAWFDDETSARVGNLEWAKDVPKYRSYEKSWWEEKFGRGDHLVSIRHVEVHSYRRRAERYVVYIEKNARKEIYASGGDG